jgi:hypothetical protein
MIGREFRVAGWVVARDSLALTHSHRASLSAAVPMGVCLCLPSRAGQVRLSACLSNGAIHPSIPVTVHPPPLPARVLSAIGSGTDHPCVMSSWVSTVSVDGISCRVAAAGPALSPTIERACLLSTCSATGRSSKFNRLNWFRYRKIVLTVDLISLSIYNLILITRAGPESF